MPRDYVAEILDKRTRVHLSGPRWERFNRRIMPIMHASVELANTKALTAKTKAELFRYFPVAMVAALEGFFRMVYADLINTGEPYSGRAQGFRDLKFGAGPIVAVQGNKTRIGITAPRAVRVDRQEISDRRHESSGKPWRQRSSPATCQTSDLSPAH